MTLRATTLFLAILASGPWNAALSAVESFEFETLANCHPTRMLIPSNHQVQRPGRQGGCNPIACPAFAPVYDESEEPDSLGGPDVQVVLFGRVSLPAHVLASAGPTTLARLNSTLSILPVCRIRC